MAAWEYVGKYPTAATDLVDVDYINRQIAATNVAQSAVDTIINNGLANYANKSYADQQAALNATKAYVDSGDAGRLHVSQLGAASQIAPLNAYGRVDKARTPLGSTQRWPAPYYSPSTYQTGTVQLGSSETALYSYTQPYPGFRYKLLVMGTLEGRTVVDGTPALALVRLGSATGMPIANGYSSSEVYVGIVPTIIDTAGPFTFPIPTFASTIDMGALGGAGGGASGSFLGNGSDGSPGQWAFASVTVGSSQLPSQITNITGVVGAGGAGDPGGSQSNPGLAGAPTTINYYQSTLTGPAGAGGSGLYGTNNTPTIPAYNGYTYNPTVGATTYGAGGLGGAQGFTAVAGSAGENGLAIFVVHPVGGDSPYSGIMVSPISMVAQPVQTGPVTLYASVTGPAGSLITNFDPGLWVCPIPA